MYTRSYAVSHTEQTENVYVVKFQFILDECMTLWGEPELVHVRAERGAVACVIRM